MTAPSRVLALSGGVGGARLAWGLASVLPADALLLRARAIARDIAENCAPASVAIIASPSRANRYAPCRCVRNHTSPLASVQGVRMPKKKLGCVLVM
mgnify:CR=1 FL=1